MAELLAHSARFGCPTQSYREHVLRVTIGAALRTARMLHHYRPTGQEHREHKRLLIACILRAAVFHDLGKLDPHFQKMLRQNKGSSGIRHEDAGVLYLSNYLNDLEAAAIVSSHHQGLVEYRSHFSYSDGEELNLNPPETLDANRFRVGKDSGTVEITDKHLEAYLNLHQGVFGNTPASDHKTPERLSGFTRRLLLSCLVDADHSDTAHHYKQLTKLRRTKARWAERLRQLDTFVNELSSQNKNTPDETPQSDRQKNRSDFYTESKIDSNPASIRACDAPVGTGKTTAVMAHLLGIAKHNKCRHIFVILPFTNIVKQSVEVYRRALRLSDESDADMLSVVAEHHHQADFESEGLRHLTTNWQAPIIVTTAVQFFETLAAVATPRLRKLHELPGSAVFLDEAHAALPAKLWPICWQWLKEWVQDWTGHLVLASGSLPQFWTMYEFQSLIKGTHCDTQPVQDVAYLAPTSVAIAKEQETFRVNFETIPKALTANELIQRVHQETSKNSEPSLVVVNTVQAAAYLARLIREGTTCKIPCIHLSTALAPIHRAVIVDRIKEMLRYQKKKPWILIATSLVEAGLDFSFASAFRQRASATSLIQIAGRVNRHSEIDHECCVWDFDFLEDDKLKARNPNLDISATVLKELWDSGYFKPKSGNPIDFRAICFAAMQREFSAKNQNEAGLLIKLEGSGNYPEVAEKCKVIDQDSRTVIIDSHLADNLAKYLAGKGPPISRKILQSRSIQLYHSKIKKLGLCSIGHDLSHNEIFRLPEHWPYDPDFIGYMDGALSLIEDNKIASGFLT